VRIDAARLFFAVPFQAVPDVPRGCGQRLLSLCRRVYLGAGCSAERGSDGERVRPCRLVCLSMGRGYGYILWVCACIATAVG